MTGARSFAVAALALVAATVSACGASGGPAGAGSGAGGHSGSGGAAGVGGGGAGSGGGGGGADGGPAGDGAVDGGGDGATDGPVAFDLDGVRMSATVAAAQIGTAGTQMFLRVRGNGATFSIDINLVGAGPFSPGSYSCNPTAAQSSLVTYIETATSTSYTSFESSCSVTITQVGAVDAPVVGTFSGMVRNGAGTPKAITNGVFDVLRAL